MKHAVFVGTCVIAVLVTSCTLPEPVANGEKCEGIKAENIVWGTSDACVLASKHEERNVCDEEAEEVVQLAGGYCPIGFVCRKNAEGEQGCVHSCPDGQVFCGDACINPKTNILYCGANVKGTCTNDTKESDDYKGENCMNLANQHNFAYECEESECVATKCPIGTYEEGEQCLPNDNNNCGKAGNRCSPDQECSVGGTCEKICTTGYIRCYSEEDVSLCIHPDTNQKFCGAKDKCMGKDRGAVCGDDMLCVQGECIPWKCAHENERVCDGKCVDVSKNTSHCGGCGNNCANHQHAHVKAAVTCEANRCVYTCEEGYEDCGTDGAMECVDLTWHRHHCGSCGHACEATEYCMEGTCKPDSCPTGFKLVDGSCVRQFVVGEEIEFGRYPQDENSNTPSPITWQVLEVTADSALLISKYVLEQSQYHDKSEGITWEQSNVRSYLNGFDGTHNKNGIDHTGKGFIDIAFTPAERKRIKKVTNKNPDAPESWNSTPGGNDTEDSVFLLSHDEALKYFPKDKSRIASPTAYVIHPPEESGRISLYTCRVTCSEDESCSESDCNLDGTNVQMCLDAHCGTYWWLRSPGGNNPSVAVYVNYIGSVSYNYVDNVGLGLRPALYVHLNL